MRRRPRLKKPKAQTVGASLPNQAPTGPVRPSFPDLRTIYKKYVDASITARIQAMFEALTWWDNAMLYFLSKGPLDSTASKKFQLATKTRSTGVGTGVTDHERELALTRTLTFYETIWSDPSLPTLAAAAKEYEDNKADLEAKEAAFAAKYEEITAMLNDAFSGFNISFEIRDTGTDRAFDGIDKIIISKGLAKALHQKRKSEGVIPVLFSEFNTVVKSASFERDQEGQSTFSYKLYVKNVPKALDSIMAYLSTAERRQVFKAASVTVQASSNPDPAQHTQRAPRAPGAPRPHGSSTKRPIQSFTSNPQRIGGRYLKGSNMAILYERLSDGQEHALTDLFTGLDCSDPSNRLTWLARHGNDANTWRVVITKTTAKMTLLTP
jgi:hypothetical protein